MTEFKTSLFSKLTEEEKTLAIQAFQNPIIARGSTTVTSHESDEERESFFPPDQSPGDSQK